MKIRKSRKTENIRMEKNYRRNREYLYEVKLWKKKYGVKVKKKMEKRQIKKSGQKEEEKKIEGEKDPQKKQEKYDKLIREVTPTYCLPLNMFKAFLVGGSICTVGQILLNSGQALGLSKEDAGYWTSLLLILASVILTGLNIYPSFAKFGGAGALVPITGFANGVASSATEYKREGQVFGIGCQIFGIAGPVILYGIFTSWVLGVIYWILKCLGIV